MGSRSGSLFPDWPSIVPDSAAPLALGDDPDFLQSQPSIARGCFVRLDEVAAAAAKRSQATAELAVFADVLRIEGPVGFALHRLTLHARRIEVGAGASLGVEPPAQPPTGDPAEVAQAVNPTDGACRLAIRADEWAFEATATHLPLDFAGVPHALAATPAGGGIDAVLAADGSVDLREVATTAPGDALTGQITLAAARRLVHCPRLDEAWTRALPLKIADWVARTGADSLLRSDAAAFASYLRSPLGRRPFVPYLRLAEYGELARVTQTALQASELACRQLLDRALAIDDRKQAANDLLAHYGHAKAYAGQLLQQAAADAQRASQATQRAQAMVDERRSEVEAARKAFEAGIAAKKAELERKAVLAIVGGVLALGAGIAMVCVAGPAGAPAAAAGAAQIANAGAQTARQVNRLVELLKTIAKVLDAIHKMKGYYALLKSAFDAVNDPLVARQRAEAAGLGLPQPLAPEDVMGAADWDEFMVALDASFAPALEQGVAGAADFLLALKKLAIRGKDLVATQAQLDRAQQRFQQCLWQTLRDDADLADMRARIAALDAQRGPGAVLLAYYAQLRDQLKFRLIHAIGQMAEAYRYVALAEPPFEPDVGASGADLARMLADMQQALVAAKERRGPVSDWGPEGLVEQSPEALGGLRRTGSLSWVVGADNFDGLDRVRVRDIRVWVHSAAAAPARLHVTIETSGEYLDRRSGERFDFAAWPLQRSFRYEPDPHGVERDPWGQPVRITLRANDAEGDYFEPTAFTTWTISLPERLNPGLDRHTVDALVLEFIGTAMSAPVTTGGVRATRRARPHAAAPQLALIRRVVTL